MVIAVTSTKKIHYKSVMILDKSKSSGVKALAWKKLMEHALLACGAFDIDKLYAVVYDDHFKNMMAKHYDFKEITDSVLTKEIKHG